MSRIYIAAKFSKLEEMRENANQLARMGHVCTSSWLKEDPSNDVLDDNDVKWKGVAETDLYDLVNSEAIMIFTEDAEHEFKRGGKMVEFGFALGYGLRLIVIGPRQNIFMYLDEVEVYETLEQFLYAERYRRY
jgi:uncharacterized protein YuzB (UPF0349 family)